jgi:type IV pilus assembly protein PilB
MTNMGVEPFLVTASVNMLVAQRLVRRVCENCRQSYSPPTDLIASLGFDPNTVFFRGQGCDRCHGSGYKGRLALYEVMILSDVMRDRIIEGISSTGLKRLAIQEGMQTLRMAGLEKIAEGVTTIDEVLGTTAADER